MPKTFEAVDPATELQEVLREGRKRPLNYALLKTKEGVVLKTDPKKSAEVMFRLAKAEGGMPAFASMGSLTVDGKLMIMSSLNEEVPRNLPRLARKHFAKVGLKTKVQVRLPSGGTLDDEDSEIEGAVDIAAVEDRLAELSDRLDAAGAAPPALRDDLADRIAAARLMLTDGRAAEAPAFVDGIETDLAAGEAELVALRERLDCEFLVLSPDLDSLLSRAEPNVVKKAEAIAAAYRAGIGDDLRKAQSALVLLRSFVGAELAKLPPVTPGEDPASGTSAAPETAQACISEVSEPFGGFWAQICEPPPRQDAARAAEHDTIMAQQDRIVALYKAGVPAGPERDALFAEMRKLSNLVATSQKIARVEETQPETAARMREAMTGFDAELGAGTEVTDELLAQCETDSGNAHADLETAKAALLAARALPAGPARETAEAAAVAAVRARHAALVAANKTLTAARGKRGLDTAMTTGPLAPDAARPLEDADAARFVEAFPRRPMLAEAGLETASTALHPGAVADGMAMLCDKLDDGFQAADGSTPASGFDGHGYATDLMRSAGAEGGDFMAKAADYIGRGGHLQPAPIPSPSGYDPENLERDRTNYLAAAVMGPNGQIDPTSPQAQEALDHLRFSPEVIIDPTPALNVHVIKTFDLLADLDNQAEAQAILDGVGEPEGTAQSLLGRALCKAPGDLVTGEEARGQVMAAMLTPVFQGDVGSCFATAGVRRLSQTDPLEMMRRYGELAETGTFVPRNGELPIPAVMSFDDAQNPLIRAMEYSVATVMGGMEEDWVRDALQASTDAAMDGLVGAVGEHPELLSRAGTDNWKIDESLIRATLAQSFKVEYDATRESRDSNDGSSSLGVYVLVQIAPTTKTITSKSAYGKALTERVLAAIGEPAESEKGKEIARVIKSRDFLSGLVKDGMSPWNFGGGGQGDEADEVLFGGDRSRAAMTDDRTILDTLMLQSEGARSVEVLAKLLQDTQGSDAAMLPLSNNGIHVFNMLPGDPSLAALREGGDFVGNIERELLLPGKAIAETALGADKAAEIARELENELGGWDSDPTRTAMLQKALRGSFGGKTPGQMKTEVMSGLAPWVVDLAKQRAADWQAEKLAAGASPGDAECEKKLASLTRELLRETSDAFLTTGAKEIRLPQVTIADTNWGDAGEEWPMVMAPDPTTGQLILWQREKYSGEMIPMGGDWVDAGWERVTQAGEE